MPLKLPDLPYANDALEPHISAETFSYHYGKHHRGYVAKTNDRVKGANYEEMSVIDIIRLADQDGDADVFNVASQAWNHAFFWRSMSPKKTTPGEQLAQAIEESFQSLKKFREAFVSAGKGQFGSGWVWLVKDGEALKIVSTENAGSPLTRSQTPLLTCDVWEHAYYLDFKNDRAAFLQTFVDNLINWNFAEENFLLSDIKELDLDLEE